MANQQDIDRWKGKRRGAHEGRDRDQKDRKDHWNKWAEGRLKAKAKLEEEGKWAVDEEGEGANAETTRWMKSASVDFSEHVFEEDADFSGFIFPHTAKFDRAIFKQGAGFEKAAFSGPADFNGAAFYKDATYRESTFHLDARFFAATFSGTVQFFNATFSGTALFVDAKFYGIARFDEAKFPGGALFGGANFCERAWFEDATFSDVCWFHNTVFLESATFRKASFSGDASFNNTTFQRHAMFGQCTFDGSARFNEATFIKDASFRSAESKGPFSLADTDFRQVPDFIQMSFLSPPRLDDLKVIQAKPFQHKGNKNRAARYRALKKIAIESHDHVREQAFFASELRERRGGDDPVGSPRYILSFIYEVLSDFGTSLKRPVWWLFGAWLVMAAIYGTAVPAAFRNVCGWTTAWMAPEHYLSLLHTLPFVGLVRSGRRELALECLYGSKDGFGAGTDVLFIAHNTFSAVLIFLFFLALRNHFKIK